MTFVVNKLHPCFDEATKLSYKLGEGGSPNHGSLPVAEYECLWPQVSCVKAGGFLGQLFLKWFFFLGRCHTWTWQQKSLKYKNPIYFLLCAIKRNYVNFYFLWLRTNFVSARHFENKTNSYKQPRRIVLWFTKHRKRFRKGPSVEHIYFCNENNNILPHQQIHQSYAELLEPILIPSLVTLVVNKLHPRFDEATKLSY